MNEQEFTRVFQPLLPKVSSYLVRRVPSQEVEDLASRVFEIAWQKRKQCPTDFELAWLYRICGFVVANFRRKQSNRGVIFELFVSDNPAPAAEDMVIADLHLRSAFQALAANDRQVLALYAFDGLSVAELAIALETTPNTATQRLKRARNRLAIELSKE